MSSYVSRAVLLAFFISIFACTGDKGKNIPDVSHIDVSLNVKHFERDLFALDTSDLIVGKQKMEMEYPIFLKSYIWGKYYRCFNDRMFFLLL